MRHGFLFTAFANPANLAQCITHLKSPDSSFFIHVNKRVDINADEHFSALQADNDVHFLNDRVAINWGGFTLTEAIIKLMCEGLKQPDIDYFHYLSDSCYPVKSIASINEYFEKHKGKEFIAYEPLPNKIWPYGGLNRVNHYHLHDIINLKKNDFYWYFNDYLDLLQKHLGLKRKQKGYFTQYYGGSCWWSLSREAVQYCIDTIDSMPGFFKRFRNTYCFEEICFQTLLVNSTFKEKITNDNLRYVEWAKRNGSIPANLDETDFEKITTGPYLFARKFTYPVSTGLQKMVAAHLQEGVIKLQ